MVGGRKASESSSVGLSEGGDGELHQRGMVKKSLGIVQELDCLTTERCSRSHRSLENLKCGESLTHLSRVLSCHVSAALRNRHVPLY